MAVALALLVGIALVIAALYYSVMFVRRFLRRRLARDR